MVIETRVILAIDAFSRISGTVFASLLYPSLNNCLILQEPLETSWVASAR